MYLLIHYDTLNVGLNGASSVQVKHVGTFVKFDVYFTSFVDRHYNVQLEYHNYLFSFLSR